MAKFPPEYKAAVEAAEKELPILKERKATLIKQMEDLDRQIMLAQNIIALWSEKSGEQPYMLATEGLSLSSKPETSKEEKRPLHDVIAEILRDGRTLPLKQILPILSNRMGRPVSSSTVYSAIVRKRELFEKRGKGYRLRSQYTAG